MKDQVLAAAKCSVWRTRQHDQEVATSNCDTPDEVTTEHCRLFALCCVCHQDHNHGVVQLGFSCHNTRSTPEALWQMYPRSQRTCWQCVDDNAVILYYGHMEFACAQPAYSLQQQTLPFLMFQVFSTVCMTTLSLYAAQAVSCLRLDALDWLLLASIASDIAGAPHCLDYSSHPSLPTSWRCGK